MYGQEAFKDLEQRITTIERNYAAHDAASREQIKTLFNSVQKLYWVSCVFGGILLLTVVYGAIGEHGFNHVTQAAKELRQ
jgi:hypothetical protein